jgi:hypothetical protein
LRYRRQHLIIVDIQSLRGPDFNTGYFLVLAKLRDQVSINKLAELKFGVDGFGMQNK